MHIDTNPPAKIEIIKDDRPQGLKDRQLFYEQKRQEFLEERIVQANTEKAKADAKVVKKPEEAVRLQKQKTEITARKSHLQAMLDTILTSLGIINR